AGNHVQSLRVDHSAASRTGRRANARDPVAIDYDRRIRRQSSGGDVDDRHVDDAKLLGHGRLRNETGEEGHGESCEFEHDCLAMAEPQNYETAELQSYHGSTLKLWSFPDFVDTR